MVFDVENTALLKHVSTRISILADQLRNAERQLLDQNDTEKKATLKNRILLLKSKIKDAENSVPKEAGPLNVKDDVDSLAVVVCDVCDTIICDANTARKEKEKGRYHCTECEDFDICVSCYAKKPHPHPTYLEYSTNSAYHLKVTNAPTISQMLNTAFECYQNRPCLGILQPSPNSSQKTIQYFTYEQIITRAKKFGNGLIKLFSLVPRKFVAICGINSLEWVIADIALVLYGVVTVPIHTKMDVSDVESIVKNCNIWGVVCGSEDETKKFLQVKNKIQTQGILEWIVQINGVKEAQKHDNVVFSFSEIEAISKGDFQPIYTLANNSSLTTIIHTSGSTSMPKGAMITEKLWKHFISESPFQGDPLVMVCFDPFCHISERETLYHMICSGGRVLICSNPELVFECLSLAHPNSVSTTPRMWNVLYALFQEEFNKRKSELGSSNWNEENLKTLRKQTIDSIRAIFGTRIKSISSGGAPLSSTVHNFLLECFGKGVVSTGYGCTESGPIADHHGILYPDVLARIEDVPEMGYFTTDSPQRGLLWVKTKYTVSGYYNNSEETEKSFKDGWFCTGDIVEFVEPTKTPFSFRTVTECKVTIIDRKKNFFKLAQGEFVAAEKLETLYLGACSLIDQIFITCGDILKYDQNNVTAVIVPNFTDLLQLCQSNPNLPTDKKKLYSNEFVNQFILETLRKVGTEIGLRAFELPWCVIVECEQFTVENGWMTSSNKINRPALERKYKDTINNLLEKRNVKSESSLFSFVEQGGDSLSAVRISTLAKMKYGVEIDPSTLLHQHIATQNSSFVSNSTVPTSIQYTGTSSVVDILKDIMNLEEKIDSFGLKEKINDSEHVLNTSKSEGVLLTGATGFIGAFLLRELLKMDVKSPIFCLVRAKDDKDALNRIKKTLSSYALLEDETNNNNTNNNSNNNNNHSNNTQRKQSFYSLLKAQDLRRVVAISGDLSEEFFGLGKDQYSSLSMNVSVVYHCAAMVNHVKGYNAHRKANVVGTLNVIEFCLYQNTLRRLNYISTLSVFHFPSTENKIVLNEDESLDSIYGRGCLDIIGGYSQSKFAAEKLVMKARNKGLDVTIFRPGFVSWCSFNGKSNKQDWLTRLFSGLFKTPSLPSSTSFFDITPVDFVSYAIVMLASRIDTLGRNFTLCNPNNLVSFSKMTKSLIRIRADFAQVLSFDQWWKELLDLVLVDEKNDTLNALLMFPYGIPNDTHQFSLKNSNEFYLTPPAITDASIDLFLNQIRNDDNNK